MTLTLLPGFPDLMLCERIASDVTVQEIGEKGQCLVCGSSLRRSGVRPLSLWDLPWGWEVTHLHVQFIRWRCLLKCPQPPHPLEAPIDATGTKLTARLKGVLLDRYLRGGSVAGLSTWCGVPERTLWRYLRGALPGVLKRMLTEGRRPNVWQAVTHIGIDEIQLAGWPHMVAVVVDLVSGRLLDLLPDRDLHTVTEFFLELRELRKSQQLTAPLIIASDMWSDYRTAIQSVFGSCYK